MSNRVSLGLAVSAALSLSMGSLASAAETLPSISVNFGSEVEGGALNPADLTGVVPSANWNNTEGAMGTLANLMQDLAGVGSATGASVEWQGSGIWNTDQEGNTSQFVNAVDEAMMKGYLDTFEGAPGSVNFSGLENGIYDVYVYTLTAVDGRDSGNITVGGVNKKSISLISTEFVEGGGPGGPLDQGGIPGNFNLYPGVVVSDGTLNIAMPAETFRTAVNGVQLVLIPEPASLGLIGLGAMGLLIRRRR